MALSLQAEFHKTREFVDEADILKHIGHPLRLRILNELQSRGCNVTKICESLQIQQAVISQHLAILRKHGIIAGKRKGSEVFYSADSPFVKLLLSALNVLQADESTAKPE